MAAAIGDMGDFAGLEVDNRSIPFGRYNVPLRSTTVRPAACSPRNGSTLTGIVKSAIGMSDRWQS